MAGKLDVAALRQRLLSGNFTEEDMDLAEGLAKSIRTGTVDKDSLILPTLEDLKKGVGDEDVDEDDEEQAQDTPAPKQDAPPAKEEPAADAPPAQADDAEPTPIRKALDTEPQVKAAVDGTPVLTLFAKSLDALCLEVREANRRHSEDQTLIKSLSGLVESQGAQLAELRKSLAAAAITTDIAPAPRQRQQAAEVDPLKVAGFEAATALTKALQATGLLERLEGLEDAVNNRPFSGNPSRRQGARTEVRKSLGDGTVAASDVDSITKAEAMSIISKSLDDGIIKENAAENAFAQLDLAPHAKVSFGEIARRFCPAGVKEFLGQ